MTVSISATLEGEVAIVAHPIEIEPQILVLLVELSDVISAPGLFANGLLESLLLSLEIRDGGASVTGRCGVAHVFFLAVQKSS
jgi:hypothetical protein